MGQIAFLTSRQLSANEQDYMTSPEWQSYPLPAYPRHLSDGSLATDPWPGFDLHPIRSTPEGSPIGGLAEREVELGGCRETKDSQSKGSLLCIEFPAPCWLKNVRTKSMPDLFTGVRYTCVCVFVCVCVMKAWSKINKSTCQYSVPRSKFRQQCLILHRVKNASSLNTASMRGEKNSSCNCS